MRYLTLLFVLLFLLPFTAQAEEKKSAAAPIPIAVLDTRAVLEQSSAGKSISSQLNSRRESLQKEGAAFEKKVRDTEASLAKQRKDIEKEEFEKKRKGFEQEFVKTRQDILKKGNGLEQARRTALGKLQNEVAKISADIAEEKKILLVIDRESVVIGHESLDITKEVIARLNKSMQSVPLPSASSKP